MMVSIDRVIEVVTAHGYEIVGNFVVESFTYISEDGSMGTEDRLTPLSTLRNRGRLKEWLQL